MPPAARRLVEEAIALLLACDEVDGDPDLEAEGETSDAADEDPQNAYGLPEIARRFAAS